MKLSLMLHEFYIITNCLCSQKDYLIIFNFLLFPCKDQIWQRLILVRCGKIKLLLKNYHILVITKFFLIQYFFNTLCFRYTVKPFFISIEPFFHLRGLYLSEQRSASQSILFFHRKYATI